MNDPWLKFAIRIQSIAQAGLQYGKDPFDRERYQAKRVRELLVVGQFGTTEGLTTVSTGSQVLNLVTFVVTQLAMGVTVLIARYLGEKRTERIGSVLGIVLGLVFGCAVFALVMLKGDALAGIFSPDAEVVQKGFEYLKGFAPETIVTVVLFSMVGYFNGNNQTVWVMVQGLIQTVLVRLPMAYFMSIQPNASLTMIGLSAPVSTAVGILLNVGFYIWWCRKLRKSETEK